MKQSRMTIALAALAGLASSAAALAQDAVRTEDIGAFSRLDAGGRFDVRFSPADTPSIRLEGDAEDIAEIEFDIRNGELEIRQDRGAFGWFRRQRALDVTVHVSAPDVTAFNFSRGIVADVTGLAGGDFDFNVSTGSNSRFSGTCDYANINVSTGANLNGRELVCDSIRVNASTGSSITVNASESLTANVSTGADVRSLTEPASVRANTSTGGDVRIGSR